MDSVSNGLDYADVQADLELHCLHIAYYPARKELTILASPHTSLFKQYSRNSHATSFLNTFCDSNSIYIYLFSNFHSYTNLF